MLDLQALPSLEKFDSQLLDLFKASMNEPATGGLPLMDEYQAPDSEAALQHLMAVDPRKQLHMGSVGKVRGGRPCSAACSHDDALLSAGGSIGLHLHVRLPVQGFEHSEAFAGFLASAQPDQYFCDEPAQHAGNKRKNRGSRMDEIIKAEEEPCSSIEGDGDSKNSTQSPTKRARGDSEGAGRSHEDLTITPDMDDATRTRIRREKNRVAARKCRAKKLQFMVDLQKTLRELMRKNEEYRLQVSCCTRIGLSFGTVEFLALKLASLYMSAPAPVQSTVCWQDSLIWVLFVYRLSLGTRCSAVKCAYVKL